MDYKNGKIYKLVNDELNLTYYGSTCTPLYKRLYQHKTKSNKCSSKILFEKGEVKIYLVEKFPCNDRIELNQKERYYIENNDCVNKRIPARTKKERNKIYRENNKDLIKKKDKEYRENNKDKINKRKKEYRENNKDKIKEYNEKYKQKKIQENNKKFLEREQIKIVYF